MGKKLKSHPASLKFKVVLESFTTNNVAETARKYGLNANQLSMWRSYFQEHGPSIFQTETSKREHDLEKQVDTLEQLLGKSWEVVLSEPGTRRALSREISRLATSTGSAH
jgi:transposase-like protein